MMMITEKFLLSLGLKEQEDFCVGIDVFPYINDTVLDFHANYAYVSDDGCYAVILSNFHSDQVLFLYTYLGGGVYYHAMLDGRQEQLTSLLKMDCDDLRSLLR